MAHAGPDAKTIRSAAARRAKSTQEPDDYWVRASHARCECTWELRDEGGVDYPLMPGLEAICQPCVAVLATIRRRRGD